LTLFQNDSIYETHRDFRITKFDGWRNSQMKNATKKAAAKKKAAPKKKGK
jgi:hypothetical protein